MKIIPHKDFYFYFCLQENTLKRFPKRIFHVLRIPQGNVLSRSTKDFAVYLNMWLRRSIARYLKQLAKMAIVWFFWINVRVYKFNGFCMSENHLSASL